MKRALYALALVATPAYANGFDNREIAFQALNAVDAAQTCSASRELNPLYGEHPSCAKVVGIKAGFGLFHYVAARWLNDRDPHAAKIFQIATIAIQGGVVAANLRFTF